MRELIVLSPCFYPNPAPAELLLASAAQFKLPVQLYGVGQTFIAHGADAQVVKLLELMRQEKLAEHVLVTDCRDVLMLAPEGEILDKFRGFESNLVMSTERGCWPPDPEIVQFLHNKNPHGYNYVNAGQYIGKWDFVIYCLQHLLTRWRGSTGADNSQGWWMWSKVLGELLYELDANCEIFQSMSGGADSHTEVGSDKVLVNKVTGSRPCSVHFNGNPGNDQPLREMYWRLFR